MDNTYNDEFKMRSFTKEEMEEYYNYLKNVSNLIVRIDKEKYNTLRQAFLNLMADSKCYCDELNIESIQHSLQCYYCEYEQLRKQLLNEDVIRFA